MANPRRSRSSSRAPISQRSLSSDTNNTSDTEMKSVLSSLAQAHHTVSSSSQRANRAKKRLSIELGLSSEEETDPALPPRKRLSTENLRLALELGSEVPEIDLNEPRRTRPRATGADAPNYNLGQPSSSSRSRTLGGTKATRARKYLSRKLPGKGNLEKKPVVPRPPPRVPTPPPSYIVENKPGTVGLTKWVDEMENYFHRLRDKALHCDTRRIELPTLEYNLQFVTLRLREKGKMLEKPGVGAGLVKTCTDDGDVDMTGMDQKPAAAASLDIVEREKKERQKMKCRIEKLRWQVKQVQRRIDLLASATFFRDKEGRLMEKIEDPSRKPDGFRCEVTSFDDILRKPKEKTVKNEGGTVDDVKEVGARDGEDVVVADENVKTKKRNEKGYGTTPVKEKSGPWGE